MERLNIDIFLFCSAALPNCLAAAVTVNRIRHGLHKHLPWQPGGGRERSPRREATIGSLSRPSVVCRDVCGHVLPVHACVHLSYFEHGGPQGSKAILQIELCAFDIFCQMQSVAFSTPILLVRFGGICTACVSLASVVTH